jgi:hypothetical protein
MILVVVVLGEVEADGTKLIRLFAQKEESRAG